MTQAGPLVRNRGQVPTLAARRGRLRQLYAESGINVGGMTAVATFECIGLYWAPAAGAVDNLATVEYRVTGTSSWAQGYPLWYDSRTADATFHPRGPEYRGSIVGLTPGTSYDVRVTLATGEFSTLTVLTWDESYPIKQVIQVTTPRTSNFTTTAGGNATEGYVVYEPSQADPNNTIAVAADNTTSAITVAHDYVVIRGFKITSAGWNGVHLSGSANRHHIYVEDNDISGWGRTGTQNGPGADFDAAVYYNSSNAYQQIVVRRNKIHGPRWPTNDYSHLWRYGTLTSGLATVSILTSGIVAGSPVTGTGIPGGTTVLSIGSGQITLSANANQSGSQLLKFFVNLGYHPNGPQGITLSTASSATGNNVIAHNEIYSDNGNFYNDPIGGSQNFSIAGMPGKDSDVYGNYIQGSMDDSIEAEGSGMNVRVWGNYMTDIHTGVASVVVSEGPLYVFRNVLDHSRIDPAADTDTTARGPFAKLGDTAGFGGGRRFFFHNTTLQAGPPSGKTRTLGVRAGPSDDGGEMSQTFSRNNIWHVYNVAGADSISQLQADGGNNDFNYDLISGDANVQPTVTLGASMITGTPTYVSGHGGNADGTSNTSGNYQLASGSLGYGAALPLPGFNIGAGADIGAAQHGDPPMVFGVLG